MPEKLKSTFSNVSNVFEALKQKSNTKIDPINGCVTMKFRNMRKMKMVEDEVTLVFKKISRRKVNSENVEEVSWEVKYLKEIESLKNLIKELTLKNASLLSQNQ